MAEGWVEYQYYCKRCDAFADMIAVFNKAKGRAEVQQRCPLCMASVREMSTERVLSSEDEFIKAMARQDEAVQIANKVNMAVNSLPLVGG